jgi:hypothetical protein
MTDDAHDPLSDSLIYEDSLPISWTRRDASASDFEILRLTGQNERLLHYLALLQERHQELQEDEHEWSADLSRIEAKLDMLIGFVARQQSLEEPGDVCPVRLGSRGIEWLPPEGRAPGPDEDIWICFKPDPGLLQPLQFAARVCDSKPSEAGLIVVAEFETLGEAVTDLVEKMIFRQHRRKVALLRARRKD